MSLARNFLHVIPIPIWTFIEGKNLFFLFVSMYIIEDQSTNSMTGILLQCTKNVVAKLGAIIMDNYTWEKNSNMSLCLWGIDGRSPIVSIIPTQGLVSAWQKCHFLWLAFPPPLACGPYSHSSHCPKEILKDKCLNSHTNLAKLDEDSNECLFDVSLLGLPSHLPHSAMASLFFKLILHFVSRLM